MLTIKQANLTIMVKDMSKSISFYEKMGLKLKNRWGNHYAQMNIEGLLIGLHPTTENFPVNSHLSIGFSIDNLDEAKSLLEENNLSFATRDEEGGSFLHFNDPDGTALYFIKSKWG